MCERALSVWLLVPGLFLFTGCASLITNGIGLQTGSPSPYAGLQSDLDGIHVNSKPPTTLEKSLNVALATVDAPFSAAMDTLLLPLVLPQIRANAQFEKNQPATHSEEEERRHQEVMRLSEDHLESTIRNGEPVPLVDGEERLQGAK